MNILETQNKNHNLEDFLNWINIKKIVTEKEVQAATARGLVPASGNPYKPRRWVRRQDIQQTQPAPHDQHSFAIEDIFLNQGGNTEEILSNIDEANNMLEEMADDSNREQVIDIVSNNNRIGYIIQTMDKVKTMEHTNIIQSNGIIDTERELTDFRDYLQDISEYVQENHVESADTFMESITDYTERTSKIIENISSHKKEIGEITANKYDLFPYEGSYGKILENIKNLSRQPKTDLVDNAIFQNNKMMRIARSLEMAYGLEGEDDEGSNWEDGPPDADKLEKEVSDLIFSLGEMKAFATQSKSEGNDDIASQAQNYIMDIQDVLNEREETLDAAYEAYDQETVGQKHSENMDFFSPDAIDINTEIKMADRAIALSDKIEDKQSYNFIKYALMGLQEDMNNGTMENYRGVKGEGGKVQSFAKVEIERYPSGKEFNIDKIVTVPSQYRQTVEKPGITLLTDLLVEFIEGDADYASLVPLNDKVARGYKRFGFQGEAWDAEMYATRDDITEAFKRMKRIVAPRLFETGKEHLIHKQLTPQEAYQRGLQPTEGYNWEHPFRWVSAEDKEPIEGEWEQHIVSLDEMFSRPAYYWRQDNRIFQDKIKNLESDNENGQNDDMLKKFNTMLDHNVRLLALKESLEYVENANYSHIRVYNEDYLNTYLDNSNRIKEAKKMLEPYKDTVPERLWNILTHLNIKSEQADKYFQNEIQSGKDLEKYLSDKNISQNPIEGSDILYMSDDDISSELEDWTFSLKRILDSSVEYSDLETMKKHIDDLIRISENSQSKANLRILLSHTVALYSLQESIDKIEDFDIYSFGGDDSDSIINAKDEYEVGYNNIREIYYSMSKDYEDINDKFEDLIHQAELNVSKFDELIENAEEREREEEEEREREEEESEAELNSNSYYEYYNEYSYSDNDKEIGEAVYDVLNGMIDHNEEKKAAEELNNTGREIEGFHYSVSETNTLDNVIRNEEFGKLANILYYLNEEEEKLLSFGRYTIAEDDFHIDTVVSTPTGLLKGKLGERGGVNIMIDMINTWLDDYNWLNTASTTPLNEHVGKYYKKFGFVQRNYHGLTLDKDKAIEMREGRFKKQFDARKKAKGNKNIEKALNINVNDAHWFTINNPKSILNGHHILLYKDKNKKMQMVGGYDLISMV